MTQTCVVSLEPVEAHPRSAGRDGVLAAAASIAELDREAEDKDHALRDWPEPIVDGKIDLGTVIYETLATALDPYPKREGASWNGRQPPKARESPKAPLPRLRG